MAAAINWKVQFDKHDDLGTTLMPDEIQISGNNVLGIRGRGLDLHLTLEKPVEDLTPSDISVVRHRGAYSEVPPMKAVAVSPS